MGIVATMGMACAGSDATTSDPIPPTADPVSEEPGPRAEMACEADSECGAGMVCAKGLCREATEVDVDVVVQQKCATPIVHFEFNESNLTREARNTLSDFAACFEDASGQVLIEGHADERGTEEYNLALGNRRAQAVKRYMVRFGVDPDRVRVTTKGETEPLIDRSTRYAWSQNRRAEVERR